MKSCFVFFILFVTTLALSSFGSTAAAVDLTSNGFRITGAGVPIGVLTKYGEAYARTFTDCRFVIFEDSTNDGFERFVEGRTDLLVSTRKMTDVERAAAIKNGIVSHEKALGNICIAVITNASNPVNVLTMEQLEGIFAGRIKNWKQVGGQDEAIKLVAGSEEGPGAGPAFRRIVMKGALYPENTLRVASPAKAVDLCSTTLNAIGYIPAGGPEFVRLPEARVKFLGLTDGPDSAVHFPHFDLVGESAYPLMTRLYFSWTRGTVNPCVRRFAAFFEEVCGSSNRTVLLNHR